MPKSLRVALLPDRLFLGGVCRVVRDLWLGLPSGDLQTVVLFEEAEKHCSEVASTWFPPQSGEVIFTCLGAPDGYRKVGRVRKALSDNPCDVVNLHFNTIEGSSLAATIGAARTQTPIAITFHHLGEPVRLSARRRLAIWIILSLARVVIVSTPLLADRVRSFHKKVRIEVVPLGVSPPEITYDARKRRLFYGIPEDAYVVGHLSRMSVEKGLPQVITAVKKLCKKHENLWVVSCGSADRDSDKLKQLLATELPNNSTLLGFLEDQNEALSLFDVLAVPSGWEGFGLVFVEGAMHGLPRIGTDKGGVPYVIDDGVDGFLIPEGDTELLSDRIDQLCSDSELSCRMGKAAKERALRDFTVERMAADYAAIFKEIA